MQPQHICTSKCLQVVQNAKKCRRSPSAVRRMQPRSIPSSQHFGSIAEWLGNLPSCTFVSCSSVHSFVGCVRSFLMPDFVHVCRSSSVRALDQAEYIRLCATALQLEGKRAQFELVHGMQAHLRDQLNRSPRAWPSLASPSASLCCSAVVGGRRQD